MVNRHQSSYYDLFQSLWDIDNRRQRESLVPRTGPEGVPRNRGPPSDRRRDAAVLHQRGRLRGLLLSDGQLGGRGRLLVIPTSMTPELGGSQSRFKVFQHQCSD